MRHRLKEELGADLSWAIGTLAWISDLAFLSEDGEYRGDTDPAHREQLVAAQVQVAKRLLGGIPEPGWSIAFATAAAARDHTVGDVLTITRAVIADPTCG